MLNVVEWELSKQNLIRNNRYSVYTGYYFNDFLHWDFKVWFINVIYLVYKTSDHFEWLSDCCLTPREQFSAILGREYFTVRWVDDVCFILDQHAYLDFYSASSLKQQLLHADTLSWFQRKQVLVFTPKCSVLSEEAANTIFFGFTRPRLESSINIL